MRQSPTQKKSTISKVARRAEATKPNREGQLPKMGIVGFVAWMLFLDALLLIILQHNQIKF